MDSRSKAEKRRKQNKGTVSSWNCCNVSRERCVKTNNDNIMYDRVIGDWLLNFQNLKRREGYYIQLETQITNGWRAKVRKSISSYNDMIYILW